MPDKIGTSEEWQAARDELAKLEAEHAKLGQQVTEQRRQLPWVPVEKEYQFDTVGATGRSRASSRSRARTEPSTTPTR